MGRICEIWYRVILHLSFSSTESGKCSYHLSLHSRWNFLHSSKWISFAILSYLFQYWFFARLGQTLMIFVTLSTFSLQSLLHGVSLVLSMLYFIEFVLIACSCAAQRRLLVSLFSSPSLNHPHFLLSLRHSVSLTNCPWSVFCFNSFNRFSFFSFLLTLTMYFSKLSSAAKVLTRASLLCAAYSPRLHFSSSTQSSTLTRPLPPSHLGMQSLSIHDLGWSPPYMMMSFLVFLSTWWSSSFVHCIIEQLRY